MGSKKNNKLMIRYLSVFMILCCSLLFSGCSAETLSNNVEISDSCKDFDLSAYELYQLEAELTPQPALRDYLEEHFFIRKEEAKPLGSSFMYPGIKAKAEDGNHETLYWDDELTAITYINAFDWIEPETVPIREKLIEQGEQLLKEFPLDINTDFKLTEYDEKCFSPYIPKLVFSQAPEGFPISTRQRVDGITVNAGFIDIEFSKDDKLTYVCCIHLMNIKKKEPFSTINAIPQNAERISTMIVNFLGKTGHSTKFKIEDISISYEITKIEDKNYTLIPMIEVHTFHKIEDRDVYHYFRIELNTGTVDEWPG